MARDLSKYTAEQQAAIRAKRRERAQARRAAKAKAKPAVKVERPKSKTRPSRVSIDLDFTGFESDPTPSYEDAVLAEYGF